MAHTVHARPPSRGSAEEGGGASAVEKRGASSGAAEKGDAIGAKESAGRAATTDARWRAQTPSRLSSGRALGAALGRTQASIKA